MNTLRKEQAIRKSKAAASRPYAPWLKERLATNAELAKRYLDAAMEDEDPKVFLLALKDVAEAYGGIGKLSKRTKLNRENLYRMLSKRGNPELFSLHRVLNELGFRLTVEPLPLVRSRRRAS